MITLAEQRRRAHPFADPAHFIALGFGSGCAPFAPGTFGTLVAVPFYWLVQDWPLLSYLLLLSALLSIGVWACDKTGRDLGVDDSGIIVWDEFVGYLITMTAAPPGGLWLVVGFIFFRLFDIFKPWPIRQADRSLKGGFGVMADDTLAACYAWLSLQTLAYGWERLT